jgi:hypothetical protein
VGVRVKVDPSGVGGVPAEWRWLGGVLELGYSVNFQ